MHRTLTTLGLLAAMTLLSACTQMAGTDSHGIAGTMWAGTDSDGIYHEYHFNPNGLLEYRTPSGLWENGSWKQTGDEIYFEKNHRFAEYKGAIADQEMRGEARNQIHEHWTWSLRRQSQSTQVIATLRNLF